LGEEKNYFFQPPDKVMTWLYDDNGNPNFMNSKEFPVMPKNIGG